MNDLQAEIINDKTISESTLLLALQNLGTSSEPPSFWKKIINDASFKNFHRACCIFLLFQRHIHPGQRMSDLSSLIGNAEWITDDDIVLVHSIEGEIPVIFDLNTSVVLLRVFPDASGNCLLAIYLKISQMLDKNECIKLIRGTEVTQELKDAVITQIGFTGVPAITALVHN